MRKIFDIFCKYVALLILGGILFLPCRTYAMAHRTNPALLGGEVLVLFLPFIIGLLIDANKLYK